MSPKGSFVMSSLPVSQAISCHHVITEACVQSQAIPCWMCDGQIGTQICHSNSTIGLYSLFIHLYIFSFIYLFVHSSITTGVLLWQSMMKSTPLAHAAHDTVPYMLTCVN